MPDFILAEHDDGEIAAQRQRFPVRADAHDGVVDLAVARIEDVAALVFQSVALHVPDQRQADDRHVLAVVLAFPAARIGIVAGLREDPGYGAFIGAMALDEHEPGRRPVVLDLLPEPTAVASAAYSGSEPAANTARPVRAAESALICMRSSPQRGTPEEDGGGAAILIHNTAISGSGGEHSVEIAAHRGM